MGQKLRFKDVFKYVEFICLMIGSIVGVGFITGAEIVHSFSRFGNEMIFGLFLFFVLFFVLTNKMMMRKINFETNSKLQKNDKIYTNNTIFVKFRIKKFLLFINILLVASAMFSGLKDLIKQLFIHNYIHVFCLALILIFYVTIKGVKSLSKFNVLVVAFLIFVATVLCFNLNFGLEKSCIDFQNYSFKNITFSLFFSFLYVFMNIVEIQPIVDDFDVKLSKKRAVVLSFIFSCLMLALLLLIVIFIKQNQYLETENMPLFAYFKNKGGVFEWIFVFGLISGLVSTLMVCLIGVKNGLNKKFESDGFSALVAILMALGISNLEFSIFISTIYPVIGFINFVIYVFL